MAETINSTDEKSLLDKLADLQAQDTKLKAESRARLEHYADTGAGNLGGGYGLMDNSIAEKDLANTNLMNILANAQTTRAEKEKLAWQEAENEKERLAQKEQDDRDYQLELAKAGLAYNPETGAYTSTGGGVENLQDPQSIQSALQNATKTKIEDNVAYLKDLQAIKNQLTSKGWLGDKFNSQSGGRGLLGYIFDQGENGQLRTDLSTLNAKVKNKVYGSALSDNEILASEDWIPSKNKQESENIRRINSQIETKKNEIETVLKNEGLSEAQIDMYLQSIGLNVSNQDPLGLGI